MYGRRRARSRRSKADTDRARHSVHRRTAVAETSEEIQLDCFVYFLTELIDPAIAGRPESALLPTRRSVLMIDSPGDLKWMPLSNDRSR